MSSDKEPKAAKKGGGGLMKLAIPVVLLGAGGGGVYGLVATGMIGGHAAAKEDNHPRLVRKGEVDPYAPKPEAGKEAEAGAEPPEGEGGSEYRTSYFVFSEEFTANLKGSEALVQMSLACSTRRDGRVLSWLKKHELAIRSAMLNVLADTTEDDLMSINGKEHLQKRLTAAINKVLTDEEGFGGVDAVYFKSFLMQ